MFSLPNRNQTGENFEGSEQICFPLPMLESKTDTQAKGHILSRRVMVVKAVVERKVFFGGIG